MLSWGLGVCSVCGRSVSPRRLVLEVRSFPSPPCAVSACCPSSVSAFSTSCLSGLTRLRSGVCACVCVCFLLFFPLSSSLFLPVLSLCCCLSVASCFPPSAPWLKLRFPFAPLSFDRSWIILKGRAFHHHLARAIMHLNYLAGLLPFFEPSIEYDEAPPPANFRLDHPNTRGLHTFVPRPTSEGPPTLVSHGGHPFPHGLESRTIFATGINELSTNQYIYSLPLVHLGLPVFITDPGPTPTPGSTTTITFPTAPTRTTTPVPVRSKQRSSSLVDPQPKKKQKGESIPEPRLAHNLDAVHSTSLPILSEARSTDMNSDDSDGEAASREDISYIPLWEG